MKIDMDVLLKPSQWPNSARFLVAANFLMVFMVLFCGWNVSEFLFLYWLESAIIGFFNIFKILLSDQHHLGAAQTPINSELDQSLEWVAKIFICGLFMVHFGIFMLVHGFFLVGISKVFKLVHTDIEIIDFLWNVKWVIGAFVLSHGYSFFANYLAGGEYKTASVSDLVFHPYSRIIVMHFTILVGVFLMFIVGKSAVLIILFTLLKTVADLKAHLKEREKFRWTNF